VSNGGSFYETLVVFITDSGYAVPDHYFGSSPMNYQYYMTPNQSACSGGGAADRAQTTIRFVDMTALGFDRSDPTTWMYKSIYGLNISLMNWTSEGCGMSGGSSYATVTAYRGLHQDGQISGSYTAAPTGLTTYTFSSMAGIMELQVISDYCTNYLDAFIIKSSPVPLPSMTVLTPNGGETWQAGTTHTITWTQTELDGTNVNIDLWKSAVFDRTIAASVTATAGSYSWAIPLDLSPGTTYTVNISSLAYPDVYDDSDNWFTITAANPVPTISSLNPSTKTVGDGAFTLTVTGTNFIASSTVQWNETDRPTTYVSATTLTAAIPASDIASAGSATVTVVNLAPGGGISNGVTFTITPPTVRGDLTGDGEVKWDDVVQCAYMSWGLVDPDPAADFDGQNGVDWTDVVRLAYYQWGLITDL
jgi:hypothetical protein